MCADNQRPDQAVGPNGIAGESATGLSGTVAVSFNVTHRLALSLATKGWSEVERQALRDGDPEAREALMDAVFMDGKRSGFDDVDPALIDLRIDR